MDCITVEDRPGQSASERPALDALVFNVHSHCLFWETGQGCARLGTGSADWVQVRRRGGVGGIHWVLWRKGQWGFDTHSAAAAASARFFTSTALQAAETLPRTRCRSSSLKNPLPPHLVYIKSLRHVLASALEKLS